MRVAFGIEARSWCPASLTVRLRLSLAEARTGVAAGHLRQKWFGSPQRQHWFNRLRRSIRVCAMSLCTFACSYSGGRKDRSAGLMGLGLRGPEPFLSFLCFLVEVCLSSLLSR